VRKQIVDVMVTGAGGMIGGHLVKALLNQGLEVRAVDVKGFSQWHQHYDRADNRILDLRDPRACDHAVMGVKQVYNLAANMGGSFTASSDSSFPAPLVSIPITANR
jgi:GDP-D-mannose 3',5'-epimerase